MVTTQELIRQAGLKQSDETSTGALLKAAGLKPAPAPSTAELMAAAGLKPSGSKPSRADKIAALAALPTGVAEYGRYKPFEERGPSPLGQALSETAAAAGVSPARGAAGMVRGIGNLALSPLEIGYEMARREPVSLGYLANPLLPGVEPEPRFRPVAPALQFAEDIRKGAFGKEPTELEQWAGSIQQRPLEAQKKAGVPTWPSRIALGGIELAGAQALLSGALNIGGRLFRAWKTVAKARGEAATHDQFIQDVRSFWTSASPTQRRAFAQANTVDEQLAAMGRQPTAVVPQGPRTALAAPGVKPAPAATEPALPPAIRLTTPQPATVAPPTLQPAAPARKIYYAAGHPGSERGDIRYVADDVKVASQYAEGGEFGRKGAKVQQYQAVLKVFEATKATPQEVASILGKDARSVEPDGNLGFSLFESGPEIVQRLRDAGYDAIRISEGEKGTSIAVLGDAKNKLIPLSKAPPAPAAVVPKPSTTVPQKRTAAKVKTVTTGAITEHEKIWANSIVALPSKGLLRAADMANALDLPIGDVGFGVRIDDTPRELAAKGLAKITPLEPTAKQQEINRLSNLPTDSSWYRVQMLPQEIGATPGSQPTAPAAEGKVGLRTEVTSKVVKPTSDWGGITHSRALELEGVSDYPRRAAGVIHFDRLTADEQASVLKAQKTELATAQSNYRELLDAAKAERTMRKQWPAAGREHIGPQYPAELKQARAEIGVITNRIGDLEKRLAVKPTAIAVKSTTPTMFGGHAGERGELGQVRIPGGEELRAALRIGARTNEYLNRTVIEPVIKSIESAIPRNVLRWFSRELHTLPEARDIWMQHQAERSASLARANRFVSTVIHPKMSQDEIKAVDLVLRGIGRPDDLPEQFQASTTKGLEQRRVWNQEQANMLRTLGILKEPLDNYYPQKIAKYENADVVPLGGRLFKHPRASYGAKEKGHLVARRLALKGLEERYTVYHNGKFVQGGIFDTKAKADVFVAKLRRKHPRTQYDILEPLTVEQAEAMGMLFDPRINVRGFMEGDALISKTKVFDMLGKGSEAVFSERPGPGKVAFQSLGIRIPPSIVKNNPNVARLVNGYLDEEMGLVLKGVYGESSIFTELGKAFFVKPQVPLKAAITWANPVRQLERQTLENNVTTLFTDAKAFFSLRRRGYQVKARALFLAGRTPNDPYWKYLEDHGVPEETYVGHVTGERIGPVTRQAPKTAITRKELLAQKPGIKQVIAAAQWAKTQYGATDLAHKYGVFRHYVDRGMNFKDALTEMENHTFNWVDMPYFVKKMNQWVPFAPGVLYNMARLTAHQLRAHPASFLVKAAILATGWVAAQEHMKERAGVTDKELRDMGDRAPGAFEIVLGRDSENRVMTWNLNWLMWLAPDIGRFVPSKTSELPESVLATMPIHLRPFLAAAMGYNEWGQSLYEEPLTERDRLKQRVGVVGRGLTPAMFGDYWRRAYRNKTAAEKNKRSWPEFAASLALGSIRHVSPEDEAARRDAKLYDEAMAVIRAKSALENKTDREITPAERAKRMAAYDRKVEEILEQLDEESRPKSQKPRSRIEKILSETP